MREVVIVSAVRTALGAFNGVYKNTTAVELGATVVREAVKRAGLQPNQIDEVIFGNVLSAGLGQNVARQVSVHAGLPIEVPSFAINKVCGSGLKSVTLAAQAIMAGDADVVVAGGTENMSRSPYVLNNHRVGNKMGNVELVDTMLRDGLTDAFEGYHMGVTAENIVKKYGFTREQQDTLALNSQLRAEAAVKSGRFKDEIVPVEIKGRKGDITVVDTDEYPKFGTTLETLGKLRPAFIKDGGSVTAGNSSGINDGAAAIILMSAEKAAELGIKPLAKFVVGTSSGVAPEIMGTGPISSSQKALERAGWTVDDLDLIEANEAFAAQALSVITDLKLDTEKVNVNGGAIALGHPVGASGARIFVTLIHEMLKRDSKKGMATLCIGGGQGVTVLIER